VKRNPRGRFWLEIALASVTSFLLLITLLWRDWIELVFGWDPDRRNGSVEWLIVGGLFVVTATMFALASIEWRRCFSRAVRKEGA
jgi:hypothetical protein